MTLQPAENPARTVRSGGTPNRSRREDRCCSSSAAPLPLSFHTNASEKLSTEDCASATMHPASAAGLQYGSLMALLSWSPCSASTIAPPSSETVLSCGAALLLASSSLLAHTSTISSNAPSFRSGSRSSSERRYSGEYQYPWSTASCRMAMARLGCPPRAVMAYWKL